MYFVFSRYDCLQQIIRFLNYLTPELFYFQNTYKSFLNNQQNIN